ncbi:MAG: archease [Candidatus Woesearchaeota archaeon]|jgi:SHS2 domain-containing protein|nr:archease [Candidatus Woesearchaeota archaeon]MDP7506030.1 archease [Candidatus Woesearchaeota archaeon]|tara:strand:+ start:269 stop:682 length:414 start_codon:yes stop_codon:yes gene_type:complete
MQKYKFINDLTSDVLFEAYGKDLKEVFENAALALFSIICQLDKVKPKDTEEFEIKGENEEDLMFNWLQGLIAIVDTEHMFFSKFKVEEINKTHIIAKLYGEPATPEKGETVVKAVTNYKYSFKKTKDGYKARVSLDI